MEWIYFLLLGSILLLLFILLNNDNDNNKNFREKQGTFGLGGINALSWYNRSNNHCWHGLNSQGCSTDHKLIF